MKLSMPLSYAGGFAESARQTAELEKVGLDTVWVAEAYGFDAPEHDGLSGGATERVEIGAAILPIFTRTPTLDRHDGGRDRRPLRRSLRPRPRCLRAAGDRGLPRRAL